MFGESNTSPEQVTDILEGIAEIWVVIQDLAEQLSKNTKLTIEEGKDTIDTLVNDFVDLEESIKAKSKDTIEAMQSRAEELKSDGKRLFEEMEFKAEDFRNEIAMRSTRAINNFRDKLNVAAKDKVDHLEHRLDNLEHRT